MSAAATTFTGADVDGLDELAQEFTRAAQVCDEVRAVCEAIVAASWCFGPFGAAFTSYLQTVVIPWLRKISEALQLMARVLSLRSGAQRSASSSATSLPSYQTPANLPQASTGNYPVLPSTVGSTPASSATAAPATQPGATTVSAPPAIGGTTGTSGGVAATLGTGDAVGFLTVPVDISPDGQITPLLHTVDLATGTAPGSAATTATGTVPNTIPLTAPALPGHAAPTVAAALTHAAALPSAHGAGGSASGGGGAFGGGSGGGVSGTTGDAAGAHTAPVLASQPALGGLPGATATAPHHAGAHAAGLHSPGGPGASHDGLYSGLGQATGIGAGAAALARATLHEVRRHADTSMLGAVPLPFDAGADSSAQAQIFGGELGG